MEANHPLYFAVNSGVHGFTPTFFQRGLSLDFGDLDFYNDLYPMKKRRSVQSILIPTFLQGSVSTPASPGPDSPPPPPQSSKRVSRDRAHSSAATVGRWSVLTSHQLPPVRPPSPTTAVSSPRDSPPPDFLLDDDPFANLSAAPSVSRPLVSPPEDLPGPPTPRSPLMPTVEEMPSAESVCEKEIKKSPMSRPLASMRMLPVAAHRRPAFSSRPSLPSLSTLAQMNVVLTKKVRKGRVGAGLPFEPWDNPHCELPPRVLQDIGASSTLSLPLGTQPFLPSQIISIAADTDTPITPLSSVPVSDEFSPTPNAISQHLPLQELESPQYASPSNETNPSSSSSESGHGNNLVDEYYSRRSSSDLGHEEDDGSGTSEEDHEGSPLSFSVYGHHQDADFDTDTTTTTSTSCDEFSVPPSSCVSSLDLLDPQPTLSRSISSNSVASSRASISSSKGSLGHREDGDEDLTSRYQDALSLEGHDTSTTTRSSLDDSDSLRSPLDSEYHFHPVASSEAYHGNSGSKLPLSPAQSSSSLLRSPPLTNANSYFPPFSSIYAQESTASDLVVNWRDQFGTEFGTGAFLSDLDLNDTLLHDIRRANEPTLENDNLHAPLTPSLSQSPGSHDLATEPFMRPLLGLAPSLPTDIPSPKSESGGGYLSAGDTWPSSADTVRPATLLPGCRPIDAGIKSSSPQATSSHSDDDDDGGGVRGGEAGVSLFDYPFSHHNDHDCDQDDQHDMNMLRYQSARSSVSRAHYKADERYGSFGGGGSKLVDGEGGVGENSRSHSNQEYRGGRVSGARRYDEFGWGRGGGSGGGGDEDDDDGRDDRRRRRLPNGPEAPTTVIKGMSSSDGEESANGYAPTATSPPTRYRNSQLSSPRASHSARFPLSPAATSSSDDDVPLAQRIPTALTAQKSIRRQVREERQHRRLERAATTATSSFSAANTEHDREPPFSRERHATLRPAAAAAPPTMPMSSSQEASLHAGASCHKTAQHNPFSPEDLAKRLQNVQMAAEEQLHHPTMQPFGLPRASLDNSERSSPAGVDRSALSRTRSVRDQSNNLANGPPSPLTAKLGLRLMRSFHREDGRGMGADEIQQQSWMPHQHSRSHSRVREEASASMSASQSPHARKRSLSFSRALPPSPHGYDDPSVPPVPPLPTRLSVDEGAAPASVQRHLSRKLFKAPGSSGRVSNDGGERVIMVGKSPVAPTLVPSAGQIVQQRVFVGDMQRFNMVEIGASTTAGDVVDMIDAQGSLNGIVGSGGWMVWEVVQDFGMERPIRSFELLSDVQASWNKDKMVNLFVLKMTPLAIPLNRSAIPSSSPLHSGYVEWEVKRGKWSKRWMQLREHSLFLSKKQGKEEVLLCSLSSFDAYFISRSHRAPKPFAFAVKSTDSLTFFENTADYLHNFACNEKDGRVWMEKILVARSYVLHQERQVLFNPKAAVGNVSASLSRSGTISRTGTSRRSTSQRPIAPLVSVPPPYSSQIPQRDHVFEPGSLLHKQS